MDNSDAWFRALLFFTFLSLIVLLLFTGCSADNPYVEAWNEGVANAESKLAEDEFYQDHYVQEYFEKVGDDSRYSFYLYRDIRTDVMYFTYTYGSGYGRGAALSVMYAADGTPLLYSEWLALEADQEVSGDA